MLYCGNYEYNNTTQYDTFLTFYFTREDLQIPRETLEVMITIKQMKILNRFLKNTISNDCLSFSLMLDQTKCFPL